MDIHFILWKSRGLRLWWWNKGVSHFYSDLLMYSNRLLRNLVITLCNCRKLICSSTMSSRDSCVPDTYLLRWGEKTTGWTISSVVFLCNISWLRNFKLKTEVFSVYIGFLKTFFLSTIEGHTVKSVFYSSRERTKKAYVNTMDRGKKEIYVTWALHCFPFGANLDVTHLLRVNTNKHCEQRTEGVCLTLINTLKKSF